MNSLENIKPEIRELKAYSLNPDRARIKLNQNENPWELPIEVIEETLHRLGQYRWSRYPDFSPARLQAQLAQFAKWTPHGVIAGNGSNELIQALLMVTVRPGTKVLISEPTFALYRQVTTILGGELVAVPLTPALSYDVAALRAQIETETPTVTIICSPNNPTGCVIEKEDLISLLELSKGLIVVDEAYHEFSGESVAPLLERYHNLIVLRTFSKAFAMAGLRVGYLLAAPELTTEIRKAVLPYNLNIVSQTAAEVAIEMYDAKLRPLIEEICRERERLFLHLEKIEVLEPAPSRANFIAVRSTISPRSIFTELLKRDILVRDISGHPMLSDYFRISVGTPDENHSLLEALTEITASQATDRG